MHKPEWPRNQRFSPGSVQELLATYLAFAVLARWPLAGNRACPDSVDNRPSGCSPAWFHYPKEAAMKSRTPTLVCVAGAIAVLATLAVLSVQAEEKAAGDAH